MVWEVLKVIKREKRRVPKSDPDKPYSKNVGGTTNASDARSRVSRFAEQAMSKMDPPACREKSQGTAVIGEGGDSDRQCGEDSAAKERMADRIKGLKRTRRR